MARRGPGRPTKLTPDVAEKLCQAMLTGCNRDDAAAYAGVDVRTVNRWLAQGRREGAREPYKSFAQRFDAALRVTKTALLGVILSSAKGERSVGADGKAVWVREPDWKAAAWWLERRFPEEFGRRDRLQLSGSKDEAPVRVDVSALVQDDEAQAAAAKLLERFAAQPGALAVKGEGT